MWVCFSARGLFLLLHSLSPNFCPSFVAPHLSFWFCFVCLPYTTHSHTFRDSQSAWPLPYYDTGSLLPASAVSLSRLPAIQFTLNKKENLPTCHIYARAHTRSHMQSASSVSSRTQRSPSAQHFSSGSGSSIESAMTSQSSAPRSSSSSGRPQSRSSVVSCAFNSSHRKLSPWLSPTLYPQLSRLIHVYLLAAAR